MATKKKTIKKPVKKVAPKKAVKKIAAKKPAPKKVVKKVAAKKPTPKKVVKKAVAKKPVKKVAAKKVVKVVKPVKKAAPKKIVKAVKKPVKKVIAKKAAKPIKKVAPKKAAKPVKKIVKKAVAKKPAPKKVVKKVAPKKVAKPAKKVVAKKVAPKKEIKKVVKAAPKPISKKPEPKKPEPKKVEVKKVEPKKPEVKKVITTTNVVKKPTQTSSKPKEVTDYQDIIAVPKPVPIQPVSNTKFAIPSFGTYETAADIAKQNSESSSSKKTKDKKKLFEQLKSKTEVKKKKTMKKQIELPKGYKPTDKEEYMNPNQVEYFRRKLVDWKKELLSESTETLDHLKNETWNEPDPSDQATVVEQTGLELRTRDRYRKLINKIDAALLRTEEGQFGYCEVTGEPIGIARLEARPIATMTIAAQEQHEREERMIVEDN